MTTFACDVSYYQNPVDNSYTRPWLIFRACDGTFRDPNFAANLAWSKQAVATGRMTGYTAYVVYRPGIDVLGVLKSMVGKPDAHLTVMVDVESWGGQIRGNHSADITRLIESIAAWLGNRKRVLAYANGGDFADLYPTRPSWLRLVVASYGSQQPSMPGLIGWQYSDGETRWPVPSGYPRSSKPFGACDHNVFPGLTPQQLATALGVGPSAAITGDGAEEMALSPQAQAQVTQIVAAQFSRFFSTVDADGKSHDHQLLTLINQSVAAHAAAQAQTVAAATLTRVAALQKQVDDLHAIVAAAQAAAVRLDPMPVTGTVTFGGTQ